MVGGGRGRGGGCGFGAKLAFMGTRVGGVGEKEGAQREEGRRGQKRERADVGETGG